MPKFFHTIKVNLSDDELLESYNEYRESSKFNGFPIITYKQFLKVPNINVFIDMKCLNCHFEVREHFGNYQMDMDEFTTPFPIDFCPECGLQHLVPKDIYTKLTLNVLK